MSAKAPDKSFGSWEEAVRWLIEQSDQQQLVRDCYYDPPLVNAAARYHASEEWQAIRELLPADAGRALDLGAGHGITSYALARDGWRVDALEPDGSDLVGRGAIEKLATENNLNICPMSGTGERIPFPDESFDLVLARQVLHHANDLPELCEEVYRVLKPGGMCVTVRDHVISNERDLSVFLANHPLHRLYGGEHAFFLDDYLQALADSGFVIDKVLRPFDSVINFSPYNRATLKKEMAARIAAYPLGGFFARILCAKPVFPLLLWLLSRVDSRPGRLFSFVGRKSVSRDS